MQWDLRGSLSRRENVREDHVAESRASETFFTFF